MNSLACSALYLIFPIFVALLKKGLRIVVAACMAVLLLFGTTAKEFIHSFTDHHDTVDHYHAPGEYSFENEHHHCDFLSYSLPAFYNDISFPYIPVLEQSPYREYVETETHFVHRDIVQACLRGPPALSV